MQIDCSDTIASVRDEDVDVDFVLSDEELYIELIEKASVLSLRQDEVEEQKETKIGVEGKSE